MAPEAVEFPLAVQVYASAVAFSLALFVFAGMNFVNKLGVFFVFIVFFTLFVFYVGLATAPSTDAAQANSYITGLDFDTLKTNWPAHYGEDMSFGVSMSLIFPCFTGILSGSNRADVLRDPP